MVGWKYEGEKSDVFLLCCYDCMSTDWHPSTDSINTPTPTCTLAELPYQGLYKLQASLNWKALISSGIIDISRLLLAWLRRGRKVLGMVEARARGVKDKKNLSEDDNLKSED